MKLYQTLFTCHAMRLYKDVYISFCGKLRKSEVYDGTKEEVTCNACKRSLLWGKV